MPALRACCFLSVLFSFAAIAEQENEIAGLWQGEVDVPGEKIAIIFEIEKQSDGKHSGTLLVPKQHPHKIPLTLVMVQGKEVTFDAKDVDGGFTGKLSGSGKRIKGKWEQGEYSLPLTLELEDDKKSVSSIARPQLSANTSSYISREVTFSNPADGYTLAGTLTLPKDPFRPVPGVVLVSDSGPHDRDATVQLHKPFYLLADYLTKKGFAVLRYDDRGVGKSGANYTNATINDFVTDAEAAMNFLRTEKNIDNTKLGLVGHGEGGLVAALVATRREDAKYIVMMAAPGLPGRETLITQNFAIGTASNAPPEFIKLSQNFLNSLYDVVLSEAPDTNKLDETGRKFKAEADKLGADKVATLAELGLLIKSQVDSIQSPWMRNYLSHDPGPVLEKVKCPVLAIVGDKDLQVIAKYHLPEIEKHLKAGGNRNYSVRELKGLNHLFQECETGLPGEYGTIEQTVSPRVLKGIGEWLISVNKSL